MDTAGIDRCIMTRLTYTPCKWQCHGRLHEGLLEMLVEAEETAVSKTAASWRKPKNKSSAQKQKMP